MKIGINGFGRMGRLGFRAGFDNDAYDIIQINDIGGPAATAAHLIEYDTVHGRWAKEIASDDDFITVEGKRIRYTQNRAIEETDWSECDIVIDATGAFKTVAALEPYFLQGVKKVVVAAPVKEDEVLNIVIGCNDGLYDSNKHRIVTAASCTTNCIAPAIKVIHEKIGIEKGMITTLHDLTNTQVIVDAPHKDLRRARSAVNSLIPTTTGSATAITLIYPELKGKLNGHAIRVPLLNASITDCVFELKKDVTADEVNVLLKEAAEGELQGILGYEEKPLVSADYTNDPRSGIIDAPSTMVVDGNMLKLFVWYDNEMGYAHRLMELTEKVAKSIS